MRRILVAVDGSEHAHEAVKIAADLAIRYQVPMSITHVRTKLGSGRVPPELAEYERLEHVYLTESGILDTAARRIAEDAAEQARRLGVTAVDVEVATGDAATTIVQLARDQGVDLIVMGSRGLGDLGGLFMGSVTHRVGHLAECPVLIVR